MAKGGNKEFLRLLKLEKAEENATTKYGERQTRFDLRWNGALLLRTARLELSKRMLIAGQVLRDKVVLNVSMPVLKERRRYKVVDPDTGKASWKSYTVVVRRSVAGEFPRADTTRLMKDIFVRQPEPGLIQVGTTLDYGFYLETSPKLKRSFLRRTLREMAPKLRQIIAGSSQ